MRAGRQKVWCWRSRMRREAGHRRSAMWRPSTRATPTPTRQPTGLPASLTCGSGRMRCPSLGNSSPTRAAAVPEGAGGDWGKPRSQRLIHHRPPLRGPLCEGALPSGSAVNWRRIDGRDCAESPKSRLELQVNAFSDKSAASCCRSDQSVRFHCETCLSPVALHQLTPSAYELRRRRTRVGPTRLYTQP